MTVDFVSDFWENTAIDGGDSHTESLFVAGDVRLDLFALPAQSTSPTPRPDPSVVGKSGARSTTAPTVVSVPAGTANGDVMLAIVANNIGSEPVMPDGWLRLYGVDAGALDVRAYFYLRTANSEPASYSIGNTFAVEQFAQIVTLRDASPLPEEWYFASSLLRPMIWDRDDGKHTVPSMDRSGQMLLALSYFSFLIGDAVDQTVPDGMTELATEVGTSTAFGTAVLSPAPNPTGERVFTASKIPTFTGHSITVAVLIPGNRQLDG